MPRTTILDALERKRSDPVTWRGLLTSIGLALGGAFALYVLTVQAWIKPYLANGSEAGRVQGVYRGYDRIAQDLVVAPGRNVVLFWGSSMIREGVDSEMVEALVPNAAAYNLAVSGDLPSRRLVELPRAAKLRPDCIVIGISYSEVFEPRSPYEDQIAALPPAAYAALSEAVRGCLPARVQDVSNRSDWQRLWWTRKFFLSATCWHLGVPDRSDPIPKGYCQNLKSPWVYNKTVAVRELERFLTARGNNYPPYATSGSIATTNANARSLQMLAHELHAIGASVCLINMPLHPALNRVIPPARRAALLKYLKELSADRISVVDWQDAFAPNDFADLVHLNRAGREHFTAGISKQVSAELAARAGTRSGDVATVPSDVREAAEMARRDISRTELAGRHVGQTKSARVTGGLNHAF